MNTTEPIWVSVLELDLQSETSIVSSTIRNDDCDKQSESAKNFFSYLSLFIFPKDTTIYVSYIHFYVILLHVSAVYFSHHRVELLPHFCWPVFLPDDDWNRQPKHVVKLNKNQFTRYIWVCFSGRPINTRWIKYNGTLPPNLPLCMQLRCNTAMSCYDS
jgi:hypothetical protein